MLKEFFIDAKNKKYAIGAFNICNLEGLKAVLQAAKNLSSPIIIEVSPDEAEFIGIKQLAALVQVYREKTNSPIFLNLDHARSFCVCKEAIEAGLPAEASAKAGFNMIHFDGSKLSFQENIEQTRKVVKIAHAGGVLVEGEIDTIPETSVPHLKTAEEIAKGLPMTDPDQAAEFVEKTGIDILAVFVGNLHGTYKTKERIDLDRLKQIRLKVDCFLSLHGGSGIADEDIKKAIEVGGIVKINVNTELRIVYRSALEEALQEIDSVKMYEVMPSVIDEVQKVITDKLRLFGLRSELSE